MVPEARADLRAIDREIALTILHSVDRYLSTRNGDVKKLRPPASAFAYAVDTIGYFSNNLAKTPFP